MTLDEFLEAVRAGRTPRAEWILNEDFEWPPKATAATCAVCGTAATPQFESALPPRCRYLRLRRCG